MLESVLAQWDDIEQILLARDEGHHLRDIDRSELESLLAVLLPFQEAILKMESTKYPTLPAVALIFQNLLTALAPDVRDFQSIGFLKGKLLDVLKRKLIIDQAYLVATILHPSFRALELQFLTYLQKRDAYAAMRQMLKDHGSSSAANDEVIESGRLEEAEQRRVAVDSFLDEYCPNNSVAVKCELDKYLSDSANHVSFTEILNWWKTAASSYPNLSNLARKFLAIPATSGASESVFRYAGLTVTELRNSLAPKIVWDLLFIRHNDEI
jgi:hypothetical protein